MREAYRQQLDEINNRVIGMVRAVSDQIAGATHALLSADLESAEKVLSDDDWVDREQMEIDEAILTLLATQSPVAGELRAVTSAMRMTLDIERMGDLAGHIAKVARMRYPESAVPPELRDTFAEMGNVADAMIGKAIDVLTTRDVSAAAKLDDDDSVMDRLHRSLFVALMDDNWTGGVEAAVDIALLGRYYERFADHVVEIAGHIGYLVTGELEWADIPHGTTGTA